MAKYRDSLPQLSGDLFITDGGSGTTPILHGAAGLPGYGDGTRPLQGSGCGTDHRHVDASCRSVLEH